MRITGLDGKIRRWSPRSRPRSTASKGHLRCRSLLKRLFPSDPVLEEVALPGTNRLSADFYLPGRRLVLEINGRQHGEFVRHFHKTKMGLARSFGNDQAKAEWCRLNGIALVSLDDGEDDVAWEDRIMNQ